MNPGAAHTNAIAVLTLLSLSGCGAAGPSAGPSLVTVGGTVSGLAGTGLTLTDNGIDRLAVPQDGAFAFATRLVPGSPFSVRVVTQPVGPGQICRVAGGDGRVGNLDISSVSIVCVSSVLSLLAGNLTGPGNVDGAAAVARFRFPWGIAADAGGTIYVADSGNHTIRKISTDGVVTTLAGTADVAGNSDGIGAAARFNYPAGVAADLAGNVYVADSANNAIRKITPDGMVTTLAGSRSAGSADGAGATAQFNDPQGVAVDATGTVYVADTGMAGHPGTDVGTKGIWIPATNGTIRKITPDGVVTTIAGTPGVWGNADGTGAAAQFNEPAGIAADASGTLYVADAGNFAIRKITPAGLVSTLAATAGRLGSPQGVAVGATGTIYVADAGVDAVLEITAGGGVTTIAGSPDLSGPTAVTAGPTGVLYVLDANSSAVRRVAASGAVSTFAGAAAVAVVGSADGIGAAAEFRGPSALATDAAGMVFVADSENHTIRKITPAGLVSTIAGTAGVSGSNDGSGTMAHFCYPSGLAIDALGVLYVADTGNNTIRKIAHDGTVTTLAGTPHPSGYGGIAVGAISFSVDGFGPTAQFDGPSGIAVDAKGNVYVADTGRRYTVPRPYGTGYADSNGTIRKITPAGLVSTLAGTPGIIGSADGTGSAAQFSHPTDVATDSAGNVYVADAGNGLVRKIAADGIVTTVASSSGLGTPATLAIDADGAVYVADSANATISKLTPDGAIATVVGVRGQVGFVPGSLPATIGVPAGLAVREGSLYLTSDNGVAVVRGVP